MPFRVARNESLISGLVLVTFVSSSAIMPGTTNAIDCLRPIVLRMSSAAMRAAGDGAAGEGDVAAGGAGAGAAGGGGGGALGGQRAAGGGGDVAPGGAGAGAAGGVVSAALADTLRAASMNRARRPLGNPARAGMNDSSVRFLVSVRVAKDFDALGPGDDRRARNANEKPVFDDAGDRRQNLTQFFGLGDSAERAVKNIVSAVGDERRGPSAQADRPGQPELREGAFNMLPGRREAERNDLNR